MGEGGLQPVRSVLPQKRDTPRSTEPNRAFRNFFAISVRLFTDMHGRFEVIQFTRNPDLVF